MMKLTSVIVLLTIFTINCGGFKVEAGIDDDDLATIAGMFEDSDDADEARQDPTEAEQEIEDETGATFIATYDKYADTCYNYSIPDNLRLFENDDEITMYKTTGDLWNTGYIYDDETIDLTIDGSFGVSELICVCTAKTDGSFQCSCENEDVDCAIVYGQM